MVIYITLLQKLGTILWSKEGIEQEIINFSFKMFKMRLLTSAKCLTQRLASGKIGLHSLYSYVVTNVSHYYSEIIEGL